ncbi:MAG: NrpR regulatory domain-containing protein [Spirochaetaceae bacterium]|jgi:repressor of nif and glnA expression|nr:NrpR regulatory domain-containing protein [Spirochaetaceae bacterium]
MSEIVEKKRLLILQILKEHNGPLPSCRIEEILHERGVDISERTVRFHLQNLDKRGFTAYKDKKGRYITPKGHIELSRSHVYDKIGFLSSKIDEMTYKMSFDLKKAKGTVLVNISLIEIDQLKKAAKLMTAFINTGLSMGEKLALLAPGERVGQTRIPQGYVGLATVCSISINGIMLSLGIPVVSLYGGLLEISNAKPERFTALISYEGTSLDPLEIFIKAKMTTCSYIVEDKNGIMGASYREVTASSREEVVEIIQRLKVLGLSGILELGYPGQSLMDIPISHNRCGMIVGGGLNAVAVLEESGIEVVSKALSGPLDVDRLFHYKKFNEMAKKWVEEKP